MLAVDAGPFTQGQLVAAGLVTAAADCPNNSVREEGVDEGFHCCCFGLRLKFKPFHPGTA